MNLKTRWDSSVSSPTFDGTYIFQKEWYKNVPINQSWSLLQRIQPVYEPMSYFSTGIYVRSSDNLLSAYLAYEYFQYGDNQNNGQASYRDGVAAQYPLETWGYRWIGLSYDSSNSILRSFYSLNTSSEISSSFDFVTLSERTISSNLAESLIVGQESHFYRANGNVNISDFKITSYAVPEPSALSLLAVGLGGLAMMLRRRS
ncbi:MAG: PEP-CTERM sorting domain-containing protein [Chitinophagia bacterium]|nr:PEP-CTERM sorting domain-containing protein [Chitinophagia bacterium]